MMQTSVSPTVSIARNSGRGAGGVLSQGRPWRGWMRSMSWASLFCLSLQSVCVAQVPLRQAQATQARSSQSGLSQSGLSQARPSQAGLSQSRLSQARPSQAGLSQSRPSLSGSNLPKPRLAGQGVAQRNPRLAEPLQTQAPPASSFGSGLSMDDSYLLGPGDRIRVDFFNVPEMSGEFQVLPNGTVNLPQIGPVNVRGQTLEQASAVVKARGSRILRFPVLTLSLVAARPIAIAVAGEVNRPGTYTLGLSNDGTLPILTRVLRLADGVTQSADLAKVVIRRPAGPAGGTGQLITADLRQLLRTGDIAQDIRLRDGDSIFIPASQQINPAEAWELADANFSTLPDRPVRVTVVGQVNRPGPYTIIGDRVTNVVSIVGTSGAEAPQVQVPTISRALQAAGGIVAHAADVRNVTLRRIPRTGDIQEIKIDLWKLLKTGDLRQDLPLQDGDSIEIPVAAVPDSEARDLGLASFAPGSITVNVIGEVVRPGPVQLSPNSPVLQGLTAAGGFNGRAKRGEVMLIRLNDNGTVTRQDVKVDYGKGISTATNPPLRNGDTIIVARSGISSFSEGLSTVLSPLSGVMGILRLFGVPTPTPGP
jgi:polysaccharide biosynthesis/export protein